MNRVLERTACSEAAMLNFESFQRKGDRNMACFWYNASLGFLQQAVTAMRAEEAERLKMIDESITRSRKHGNFMLNHGRKWHR